MEAIILRLSDDQQVLEAVLNPALLVGETDATDEAALMSLFGHSQFRAMQLDQQQLKALAESAQQKRSAPPSSSDTQPQVFTLARRVDASLQLIISEDRMQVEAEIISAQGGRSIDAPRFKQALVEQQIRKGIDTAAASALMKQAHRGKPGSCHRALIACGQAAIDGANGRWQSLLGETNEHDRPQQDAVGRIDLLDYGEIPSVKPGQRLMRLLPPTDGEPGFDIDGRVLEPEPGVAAGFVEAEGVELAEDGEHIVATRAGLPVEISGGIRVDNIYSVKQVNLESGHIEFDGSVIVHGDVAEMMKVVASGDVTIGGSVESAQIEAGGNLIVRKGVVGHQRTDDDHHFDSEDLTCELKAGGRIEVGFAQYARLHAEAGIEVGKQLIHCMSATPASLEIGRSGDRNAKLIGGVSEIGEHLISGEIGTDAFVPTEIRFKPDSAELLEREQQLNDAKREQEQQLAQIKESLPKLAALPKTAENQKAYKQALKQSIEIGNQAVEFDQQQQALKQQAKAMLADIHVICRATLYPGVLVVAGDNAWKNTQQHSGGGVRLIDAELGYSAEIDED